VSGKTPPHLNVESKSILTLMTGQAIGVYKALSAIQILALLIL
jgi:hypothetical protein